MNNQRFGNYVLHGHPWIKGPERVLENELDTFAIRVELIFVQAGQFGHLTTFPPEQDRSAIGCHRPHDQFGKRGFATSTFANQTDTFAAINRQRHIRHSGNFLFLGL